MKASDIMKKKPKSSDTKGKSNKLIDWIADRKGNNKKHMKNSAEEDK